MNLKSLEQTYRNSLTVWVLLKAQSEGFERTVPPGAAVMFLLPAEATLEVIPLVRRNGVFGMGQEDV
jgi:hypothetical protein